MKSFTTTQDMTQYEVSQDYCEPYLGATHDDLQAARFNKYDTHIDKNEFFIYDDVNHKYNIYRRVEYIENTTTAYIDPQYITNANSIIEIKVQLTATAAQNRIIGNTSGYFECYINGSSKWGFTSNGNLYVSNIAANTELHTFKIDNNALKGYIDVTQINITKNAASYYNNAYLISRNGSSTCKCKIYYSKIYNRNTLVRDFIPVKNTLTNQYGLLDTVEQKFYVSPNGVEFSGGNEIIDIMEIHPKLIANTYIDQNTGNQQGYNGWSSSDYIDVEGFNYIQMPYPFRDSDYKYGAYYDKDKKRISNTASLTIPSNAKYVRLSSTPSNFTNVWLFKKQLITTDIYRANSYVETNGIIKSYNGWNILNTDSEYNYFYCWIYAQNYRYQAAYNADGSVYQSGSGFLQKPEGGKVLLSDGNTSITYYAGYNYMYKDMNK